MHLAVHLFLCTMLLIPFADLQGSLRMQAFLFIPDIMLSKGQKRISASILVIAVCMAVTKLGPSCLILMVCALRYLAQQCYSGRHKCGF